MLLILNPRSHPFRRSGGIVELSFCKKTEKYNVMKVSHYQTPPLESAGIHIFHFLPHTHIITLLKGHYQRRAHDHSTTTFEEFIALGEEGKKKRSLEGKCFGESGRNECGMNMCFSVHLLLQSALPSRI